MRLLLWYYNVFSSWILSLFFEIYLFFFFFFFFQAEDGIRDLTVTGVQTCALPISSGFGAAVEAIVLFVRNDVAIANIGHDGAKFAPYILTLFFFILYCNLLGLLPWGAAPTGNLAVTGALALTSFLTVEISGFRALGPKGYLKTIVFR